MGADPLPTASPPSREVLLLDDEALPHALLGDILREAGFSLLSARTPEEADALLALSPRLAFVDFQLEQGSGDAWMRRVRQHPQHWALPLVMLTAYERPDVVRRCFAAGADDFLAKPVEREAVLAKVRAAEAAPAAAPAAPARERAVLLASGDDFFGAVVARLAQASGYQAEHARDAQQALARVGERRFDVAVVDVGLPGGAEALVRALPAPPPALLAVARRVPGAAPLPAWGPLALYDVEAELEALVKHLGSLLAGTLGGAERRAKPRVPFTSVVHFRFYGARPWQVGFGYDLSETGLFVRTLTPVAAKQPVEVRFRLGEGEPLLEARGLSIWNNPFGPRDLARFPFGMGLAFADFPLEHWTRLHEYVRQRTKRAPPAPAGG